VLYSVPDTNARVSPLYLKPYFVKNSEISGAILTNQIIRVQASRILLFQLFTLILAISFKMAILLKVVTPQLTRVLISHWRIPEILDVLG